MSKKNAYAEYLKSGKWKTIRSQRMAMDNNECVLCGEKAAHVHHRRYPKKWGTETVKDLVCLCEKCHEKHHSDSYDCDEKKVIELMYSYEGLVPVIEDAMHYVGNGVKTKEDLDGDEILEILNRFALLFDVMRDNFCEHATPDTFVIANRFIGKHLKEEHSR